MLTGPYARYGTIVLGVLLVIYAIIGLSPLSFTVARANEKWIGGVVGIITGVVSAATGVQVIPSMPFMQAIGMEKDELVQALGVYFTVATVAMAFNLTAAGLLSYSVLFGLLFLMPFYLERILGRNAAGAVAMGYGIPAAIGAKAAWPNRKVVAEVGDGGFLMSGMELATAVQERLPVVVVLVNDGSRDETPALLDALHPLPQSRRGIELREAPVTDDADDAVGPPSDWSGNHLR